ncbi:MAG: hypothetical protein K2K89_14030 [Ruminococcus sp.]|nr:hypothetical protein [Ruminococcus sp.]
MNIYTCPHCGEKTFNPVTKALAGQMNSKGRRCPECNTRCVNGKGATIFNAIYSLIAIVGVVYTYLHPENFAVGDVNYEIFVVAGIILSMLLVPRIVNAFCFKMEESIRLDY